MPRPQVQPVVASSNYTICFLGAYWLTTPYQRWRIDVKRPTSLKGQVLKAWEKGIFIRNRHSHKVYCDNPLLLDENQGILLWDHHKENEFPVALTIPGQESKFVRVMTPQFKYQGYKQWNYTRYGWWPLYY